jgi:hypothetical protein
VARDLTPLLEVSKSRLTALSGCGNDVAKAIALGHYWDTSCRRVAQLAEFVGVPDGIRTRVTAVKGRRTDRSDGYGREGQLSVVALPRFEPTEGRVGEGSEPRTDRKLRWQRSPATALAACIATLRQPYRAELEVVSVFRRAPKCQAKRRFHSRRN